MNAIELKDLRKEVRTGFLGRRREILKGVTLEAPEGCVFGFVGHNGAGKSTTIKHLFGAVRPTSGEVRVLGKDPRKPSGRLGVGYLPEVPRLPHTLTPMELLRLHASLVGLKDWRSRAEELLAKVSLSEQAHQRTGEFSKGMQQRAALALALIGAPRLLILDEPMSGLDPAGRRLVRNLIREQNEAGVTVFFSSHILNDVESLCTHIGIVHGGASVKSGKLSELVGAPSGHSIRVEFPDGRPPTTDSLGAWRQEADSFVVVPTGDPVDCAVALREAGGTVVQLEPLRATLEERMLEWFGS